MISKITALTMAIFTAVILLTPISALASTAQQAVCEGAGGTWNGSACLPPAGTPSAPSVAQKAVIVFSVIIGFIAVVMLMIGGLKYITSQGDSQSISSAKNTILYAIVGLVVAALAQAIAKFVLNKVS